MLFSTMDFIYETEALKFGTVKPAEINLVKFIDGFQKNLKMTIAFMALMWGSMCAVKFAFLALFRRLVRPMPSMMKYWWFALAFNIIVAGYGSSPFVVHLLKCPYFKESDKFKASKSRSTQPNSRLLVLIPEKHNANKA
jgi:hypothetical protein